MRLALARRGGRGCDQESTLEKPGIELLDLDRTRESISAQEMRFEVEISGLPREDLYVYWATRTSCPSMSEECEIVLRPSRAEGTWVPDTHEHSFWRREITQLRIDFNLPGGPPFVLHSIRLISDDAADVPPRYAALERLGTSQPVPTNMFDLEMRRVFELDLEKLGGGIGATDSELIVASGDAKQLAPDSFAALAAEQVQARLRDDDILVFDDARERHVIVSFAYFDPDSACFSHRVSRLSAPLTTRLADTSASSTDWTLLFASRPCFDIKRGGNVFAGHQSGGRLALLDAARGRVILALGDYEFDAMKDVPSDPQDMTADYGKMIEIDIASGTKEVVSVGQRNPQGIFVDRKGTIWSVEHGPQGGDELNRIERGANYGWPVVTQGIM